MTIRSYSLFMGITKFWGSLITSGSLLGSQLLCSNLRTWIMLLLSIERACAPPPPAIVTFAPMDATGPPPPPSFVCVTRAPTRVQRNVTAANVELAPRPSIDRVRNRQTRVLTPRISSRPVYWVGIYIYTFCSFYVLIPIPSSIWSAFSTQCEENRHSYCLHSSFAFTSFCYLLGPFCYVLGPRRVRNWF